MSTKSGFRNAINNTVGEAQRRLARTRGNSLSTIPPKETDDEHVPELAACAASILYRTPQSSPEGRPVYILNAAAFPDSFDVDYDSLLSYVLDRLPKEDELLSGTEYEIVFFAGGQPEGATTEKKNGPGIGWYIRAYEVLSRALRKKLQRLYIVHPRTWVRVLLGAFSTIVSPKFRRKLIHVNTLTALAEYIPVEQLLIPPSVYVQDRKVKPEIYVPYATGRRAFGARHPFPRSLETGETRLPRVLRETTAFLLMGENVNTEGLFRIPPNAVLSGALKEAYDRGQRWIVWKERGSALVEPGLDQKLIDYIRLEDAYAVHQAAALIKLWYRELREAVFPEMSYEVLKNNFDAHDAKVSLDDLVDLLSPASEHSPLSETSRAVLTRHLLPLLSEVAMHESCNKMTSENLAIVFSMCMVCGSNQMEDAKIANTTIKKVLIAAIDQWAELRERLGVSRDDFWDALKPPRDPREYEDPFDEPRPSRSPRTSAESEGQGSEGHRINLEDFETGIIEKTPAMPPALPPRPRPGPHSSRPLFGEIVDMTHPAPGIPKRKPAPRSAQPSPPRYSNEYGADGLSVQTESPPTYSPAEGSGTWSPDEDVKKGFTPVEKPAPTDLTPLVTTIPKRKAVSAEHKPPTPSTAEATPSAPYIPEPPARSASDTKAMAAFAAQKAASNLGSQLDTAFTVPKAHQSEATVQTPEAISATSEPATFRKPSWPASARPLQAQGLAKPVLPLRQSQTVPIINQPLSASGATANGARDGVPKVRAPSPGLLKRIGSMETANANSSNTTTGGGVGGVGVGSTDGSSELLPPPRKLNLKKQSVEDLRRLYEERNSVAEGLGRVEARRRVSEQGLN